MLLFPDPAVEVPRLPVELDCASSRWPKVGWRLWVCLPRLSLRSGHKVVSGKRNFLSKVPKSRYRDHVR